MASSLFQVTGVSSGIDWGSIIDQTIEAAKKPATQWQTKIDSLEIKKTLYQQLSGEYYALRNTLTSLKLESTYLAKTAEFVVQSPAGADASGIVKATVKTNAAIASWDLDVQQIAKAQRHISAQASDAGTALGISGSFRIMADERWTTITIEASDTIRDINLKVQAAEDQFGNTMPITAQLIDNRLVIDSLNPGLNQVDGKTLEPLMMSGSDYMYLPRAGLNYSKKDADGNYVQSSYPPQLLSVSSGSTTYLEGVDFDYDADRGLITWKTGAGTKRPATGNDVDILYVKDVEITAGSSGVSGIGLLPYLNTGAAYDQATQIAIYKSGGGKYVNKSDLASPGANDWDYEIVYGYDANGNTDSTGGVIIWNTASSTGNTLPSSGDKYTIRLGSQSDYSTSQNKFYLEADDMSSNSVLAKLGFITIDEDTGLWGYTEGSVVEAQDAKFTINGVPVTRQTNTIEDVIANVTLDLKGVGKVTMDITQDAEKAVESMQAFVEQYNKVMTWINTYLNEKADATTSTDDDYMSELLANSKGETVFGLLHGDSLLWSIKNQMRSMLSNPVTTASGTLNSRKFLHPAEALTMQGSFYINVGGMSSKITVDKEDSLENIQKKIQNAVNGVGTETGARPDSPKSMGLDVSISNGQLVIKAAKSTTGTSTTNANPIRSKTENYDYLSFVPESASPVNGVLKVFQGKTAYVEGTDYRVTTEETSSGVIQSKIVWLDGGKSPAEGGSYNVSYDYNASAISYSIIKDTSFGSDSGNVRSVSDLNLHQDSSKISLSQYGITTESIDNGKSGLLEFDSDVFFEAIRDDAQTVAAVMTTFMRDIMDTYIGNLVDSSQMLVGSSVVTKGRVASQLAAIDDEISTLNGQITKLEKQLEQKQTALYKRYSDMEVAIQKMTAQLSSITQYFNNTNSR